MKNPDLSVKILLQKCYTEIMEKLVLENSIKIVCAFIWCSIYQIKARQFFLLPTENSRIQGLFKAFQ